MTRSKASNPTAASNLYDAIRRDLISGEFPPGAKLNQRELAARYACGTIPLREALLRLSATGYIDAQDHRGFRAARLSMADLEIMYRTRRRIELEALTASIENGDLEWESRVIGAFHSLNKLDGDGASGSTIAAPAREDAHATFHHTLIAACPSQWLIGLVDQLRDQASRYRNLSLHASKAPTRDTRAEHEAIANAAVARDVTLATSLLGEHIDATARLVEQHIHEHLEPVDG